MASKGAIGAMYEQAVDRIVTATNQMAGILSIPAIGFDHLSGKRDEFRHAKELEMIADYLEQIAVAVVENSQKQEVIERAAVKAPPVAKKGR